MFLKKPAFLVYMSSCVRDGSETFLCMRKNVAGMSYGYRHLYFAV